MPQTAKRAARGAWTIEDFETPERRTGGRGPDPLGRKIGKL